MLQTVDRSRPYPGSALKEKPSGISGLLWLLSLLICSFLVTISFTYLDVPVARHALGVLGSGKLLAKGFASAILLGIEATVVLALVIVRIVRGRLPRIYEATALACLTSICVYAINDSTLKLLFGVPNPMAVLSGARHAIEFLRGSAGSSFPSGHMALAGAFAGVFMRLYQASILLFTALLLVGAVLLIAGDWHFLSDVIAGTFLGVSAGFLAGEIWLVHSR